MPEFDVEANPLQAISHGTDPFETLFLNLTVVGGRSLIVLGHTDKPTGPAAQFVESFARLHTEVVANTSFHIPLEYIENTYLRPSWWYGRSAVEQAHVMQRLRTGTGACAPARKPDCLKNLSFQFATAAIEQELQG